MADDYRVLRCEACGQFNRIPSEKFTGERAPRCGRCKRLLRLQPEPALVTDQNFKAFTTAPIPVLVDFWAPWCGPCHALAPTIEQIAKEYAGRLLVGKLNTDENPATSGSYQIRGIPTMILFSNGREEKRLVGAHPKAEIVRQIQSLLESRR